jgi:hypothetical protein
MSLSELAKKLKNSEKLRTKRVKKHGYLFLLLKICPEQSILKEN